MGQKLARIQHQMLQLHLHRLPLKPNTSGTMTTGASVAARAEAVTGEKVKVAAKESPRASEAKESAETLVAHRAKAAARVTSAGLAFQILAADLFQAQHIIMLVPTWFFQS